jgi:hypothetical protein
MPVEFYLGPKMWPPIALWGENGGKRRENVNINENSIYYQRQLKLTVMKFSPFFFHSMHISGSAPYQNMCSYFYCLKVWHGHNRAFIMRLPSLLRE